MLRKDAEFIWPDKHKKSFNTLKTRLTEAPILAYPDLNLPFILITDASGTGLGYILSQKHPDKGEVVVSYEGRGLRAGETNFIVAELECFAILEGIGAYHPYLAKKEFTIITDHCALVWLHISKRKTGRLSRWVIQLQGYNYKVQYKKGKKNANADALSRRDYPPETHDIPAEDSLPHSVFSTTADTTIPKEVLEMTFDFSKKDSATHPVIPMCDTYPSPGSSPEDRKDTRPLDWPRLQQLQRECADLGPYID